MRGLVVVVVLLALPVQAQAGASAPSHLGEDAPFAAASTTELTGAPAAAASDATVAPTPAGPGKPARMDSSRVLGAVLVGGVGLAVTAAYVAGASSAGDSQPGGTLAIAGGVVSAGLAGAFIGLWVNWRRQEPTSMLDYLLAPLVGGLAGALLGGVLAGVAGTPPGTSRTVTHVVVTSLLFCETAGLVAVRLFD